MKLKKELSLILALVLAAQLCLPVSGVVADKPIADSGAGEIVSTDSNPEAEIPMVPAEPETPEVPATPEVPDLDASAEEMAVLAADTVTINIGNPANYIVITETGYKIGTGSAETTHTGPYILVGETTSTNAKFDHICVKNGGTTPIQITLRNMNVLLTSGTTEEKCAFAIGNGKVELTLEGSNSLQSGSGKAGIQVAKTGSLIITKGSTGSLNTEGGSRATDIGGEGAITISGGVVNANRGSGIGDGWSSGRGSTFSTGKDGNAVIFASLISDKSNKKNWSGMIFEGNPGAIYGSSFTLGSNITIPYGYTLHIGYGQTLTIPAGTTLTNKGKIMLHGGTIQGDVSGKQPVTAPMRELDVSKRIVITEKGYKIGDAAAETPYVGPYVLVGKTTYPQAANHISVRNTADEPIDITLNNVDVQFSSSGYCPLSIERGAVNLSLLGSNSLTGCSQPGLAVKNGSSLTITAADTGSLTANSSSYSMGNASSGIGGGDGEIIILSGRVNAKGGDASAYYEQPGAGISGKKVNIRGGVVNARGGYSPGGYLGDGISGAFTTRPNGEAAIAATSIKDKSDEEHWIGLICEGSKGSIFGYGSFTLPGDFVIASGTTLAMHPNAPLIVPEGKTLTVDGYIYKNGSKVSGPGNIVNPENILPVPPVDISKGAVEIGKDSCVSPCKGHVITGTTDMNYVHISGGSHDITLMNTSICKSTSAFRLYGDAKVNLTLVGTNTLKSGVNYASLAVWEGATLTITKESTGTLNATGGHFGAGIGGDYTASRVRQTGTIIINGGTVNANGGKDGAGIGGGWGSTGGNITINGGTVNATGGAQGAGIGGGDESEGGNIAIHGGTVNATGGSYGTGIGGGYSKDGGTILIDGGDVTANGGNYGAGIGGGGNGAGGNITIGGGTVHATGCINGAGIGGGFGGTSGTIAISGGKVTAKGGTYGVHSRGNGGAGIGSGINAADSYDDNIMITGGIVEAAGGVDSAGIGGGANSSVKTISMSGGTVTATGADGGAGIGGGTNSFLSSEIKISKNAVVFATKGNLGNHIGNGYNGRNVTFRTPTGGIIFTGNTGFCYGKVVELQADVTLPAGKNLTFGSGKIMKVPENITFTNNANLVLNGGDIIGSGTLNGSGAFEIPMDAGDIPDIPNQVYTGSPIKPAVILPTKRTIMGQAFIASDRGFTRSYHDNIDVGVGRLVFVKNGLEYVKSFYIVPSSTIFEGGVKVYNAAGAETTTFTYGETITVKAKPKATGTVATTLALTEHQADQMALYLGNTQISDAVDPDGSGVYTMTYDTTGKKNLVLGSNTITAKYRGTKTMAHAAGDVPVTLLPKALTAIISKDKTEKVYDGTVDFLKIPLTLTGVLGQDVVTATANGTAPSANVGTYAFTATAITLNDGNGSYYALPLANLSGSVGITPKPVTVEMTAASKVYDGTDQAAVSCTVIGKVGAEDVAAAGTANFSDKNEGIGKTVTVTGIALSGTEAGNYTLNKK
ncbi:MAG: YDG domain-containing protein, partial [Oscillospiraceae bacterium]